MIKMGPLLKVNSCLKVMFVVDTGTYVMCCIPVIDKALSDSGPLENNDQPVGNEEPVAVKEKDEVFTATPDDAKQLDEQTERTTQPAVTPPATSAVTVTSVGDVMKHDSSPAAVRKATPNTQPLPPSTSSVIPSVSTGDL